MAKPLIDRSKEPFECTPPEPIRYGDHVEDGIISYGPGDITTQLNNERILEEESRAGTPTKNAKDGANRYKDLGDGLQLRQFPPFYFWKIFKNGLQLPLGDYTDLDNAEKAAQNYKD